jgi:predicted hotdog family 3-hydroxylacyl-ACP dehydratase
MIVAKERITDFIPHRKPFVMIDNLISADAEHFESDFFIEEDNVLVRSGHFEESGLIENIAQTCAAGFGFLDHENGGEPKIGFIGAVSKVEVFELPLVHSGIRTTVTPTHQLGNIFLLKGENYCNGRKLLECEIKIVVT